MGRKRRGYEQIYEQNKLSNKAPYLRGSLENKMFLLYTRSSSAELNANSNKSQWTSSMPILSHVFCAGRPRTRKTTPRLWREMTARMTSAVNVSQPLPECELALCARTVKHALSHRTPCFARGVRSLYGTEPGERYVDRNGYKEHKPRSGCNKRWDVGCNLLINVLQAAW